MKKEYFPEGYGQFYKGNVHCHSTVSDGALSHEELVKNYKEHGYSFLCFSEHEVFTDLEQFCTQDFITIPAVEWSSDLVEGRRWLKTNHVHGIQGPERLLSEAGSRRLKNGQILSQPEYHGPETAADMCRKLRESGNLCIYNHPSWSKTSYEDYGDLKGFTAMEVWNYSGEIANHTANSCTQWDYLLDKGIKIFGVAADDNHNRGIPDDSFGGWICVKAPELSRNAIMEAIEDGNFYSSSGPEIYNFGVKDNSVFVSCSPVNHINFVSGPCICGGQSVWGDGEDSLTTAEWTFGEDAKYVRVECVDKSGHTAWSNPIFL